MFFLQSLLNGFCCFLLINIHFLFSFFLSIFKNILCFSYVFVIAETKCVCVCFKKIKINYNINIEMLLKEESWSWRKS